MESTPPPPGSPPPPPPPPPSVPMSSSPTPSDPGEYPATFAFSPPDRVANWRPLVNWLLAIPHYIVLYLLRIAAEALSLLSWFIILFTGKMPGGFANFIAMYLRYEARTSTFAGFLREEYPPFAFTTSAADAGEDPRVRVDFAPELENRNRLTVAFRLILAIPIVFVLVIYAIGAFFVGFVAFFAVLFTGRWPAGMRDFVLKFIRFYLRTTAYVLLLTDQYPPFALS
jgi:Domain of unknown function (DUF4389)